MYVCFKSRRERGNGRATVLCFIQQSEWTRVSQSGYFMNAGPVGNHYMPPVSKQAISCLDVLKSGCLSTQVPVLNDVGSALISFYQDILPPEYEWPLITPFCLFKARLFLLAGKVLVLSHVVWLNNTSNTVSLKQIIFQFPHFVSGTTTPQNHNMDTGGGDFLLVNTRGKDMSWVHVFANVLAAWSVFSLTMWIGRVARGWEACVAVVCAVGRCLVTRCTLLWDAVCHVALLCVVVMRC